MSVGRKTKRRPSGLRPEESASDELVKPVADHCRTHTARSLPSDVELLSWAAERLGIAESTAYRLAPLGKIPGAFKVGAQWRVSVPKFLREVHGCNAA